MQQERTMAQGPGGEQALTRRRLMVGIAGLAGALVVGCGKAQVSDASLVDGRHPAASPAKGADRSMTVYRDPGCGCCEAWAGLARDAGYRVTIADRADMPKIKARFGVPDGLASCHTATIGNYVIEGHVPLADVALLMERKPVAIRGIAVPGMPRGSPGMETADGSRDKFEVMAFDSSGGTSLFT